MILFLKAVRTMLTNKRAYIACIVLIAVGIMMYLSLGIAVKKLELSKDVYYKENRLAEVFATVSAIPEAAKNILLQTEGIEEVSFRLKYDARVDIPDNDKIITIRLVSINTDENPPMNKVNRTGNGFFSDNDILVAEDFLTAHGFGVGDTLNLIINGRNTKLNIVGSGESPEYIYMIKDITEVMPDAESFTVGFMPVENMAVLFNKQGVYNDVSFILSPGYTFDDVKVVLEDELSKYGLTELIPKKDLPSYSMLETEIEGNKSMTVSISSVFILMAIIVLYLMLRRVIEQDRTQIGALKAFGYSNSVIIAHYLFYGVITGFIGTVIGIVSGYYLSGEFMKMYAEFFMLPIIETGVEGEYIIIALVFGIGGGAFGAFMGSKSILKLLPSEAMRPAAPKAIKSDILKYIPFMRFALTAGGIMAVRNIWRNKFRSFFIILSVVFSFGMLAFMGSYDSMLDDMLFNLVEKVQRYDVKVSFNTPVLYNDAVNELEEFESVDIVEGFLEIPVELRAGHRKSGIIMTGIDLDSRLFRIYDNEKKSYYPPPKTGVILTDSVAEKLDAGKGDRITLSSPVLKEDVSVVVSDVIVQNLGGGCYIERSALARILNSPDLVTSVGVKASDISSFKQNLKEGENIGAIDDKVSTLKNYRDMMASYDFMIYVMQIMAMIIAVAIIYNTATISLSERQREFATLRVLGMQIKEVGAIMGFEYWVLCAFGMLFGIPFTMFLKHMIAGAMDIEMYTFPTYTPIAAYISAAIGCMLSVFFSNLSSNRKIKKFNMVEVLKDRE